MIGPVKPSLRMAWTKRFPDPLLRTATLDGTTAQSEVGQGRTDPQPISICRPAVTGRVVQLDEVTSVGRQRDAEIRIGVVGIQAGAGILMIVVKRDHLAGRIGQFQERVDWRIEAPCKHFGDNCLAGSTVDLEHVDVIGKIHAAIDDDRQRDGLWSFRGVG